MGGGGGVAAVKLNNMVISENAGRLSGRSHPEGGRLAWGQVGVSRCRQIKCAGEGVRQVCNVWCVVTENVAEGTCDRPGTEARRWQVCVCLCGVCGTGTVCDVGMAHKCSGKVCQRYSSKQARHGRWEGKEGMWVCVKDVWNRGR